MRGGPCGDVDEIGPFGNKHFVEVAIGPKIDVRREVFHCWKIEVASGHDARAVDARPRFHLNATEKAAADADAGEGTLAVPG